MADKLIANAARFDRQPYRFGYAGRSTSLGRRLRWIWAGDGRRTLPFCSELIATAYAAIGIKIGRRPPDRVLPMDLDEACRSSQWKDVTGNYYPRPLPSHLPDGTPLGLDLDMDAHEAQMAEASVMLANGRYESVEGWERLHDISDAIRRFNWETTLAIVARPGLAFLQGPDMATAQLARLEKAYDYILGFPGSFAALNASAL